MINIPYSEYKFTFSKSSGAGGQNVNKVNTRVTLTWDMSESSACSSSVKERFIQKYKRFIVGDSVVIHSQKYRSQAQNIDDCISKLLEYINDVRLAPKKRKSTRPTRSSVKKRLDGKNLKSKLKKIRSEKF